MTLLEFRDLVGMSERQIDVVEPLEQAVAMGRRDVETVARTVRARHFLALEIDGDFTTRRGMQLAAQISGDFGVDDQRQQTVL